MIQHFATLLVYFGDKIVSKKSQKNLLKNQLEFVHYNFTRKKSFTNEVAYHLSSPEFPPLEVDDDPTFPVIVSV